ncbi:MAG: PepSY domain-containing protein [Bdellovibrionota bacterium]
MAIPRKILIEMHLILGSFLLPVALMFALTGMLYTFKVTGQYETQTENITLASPLNPDLSEMTVFAEKLLSEKGLAKPTGSSSIKKVGTSWQFEWTGSKMDLIIDPTENPLEAKASFKKTSWHRFFVQLHKAKGGFPFKLLAAALGIGLILLLVSGWFLGQASPQLRRIRFFATLAGIATFVLVAGLS